MCVYSMVSDYGRNMNPGNWNPNSFDAFKQLLDEARKFDEAAGEPDCEDPSKAEFLKELEERFADMESDYVAP